MGTPDFAVAPLDALIKAGHNIVAVVTVPDKPAGRGRQLQMSAVKKYALEHHLNILQPEKLRNEEFIETLSQLAPDIMIVVAFRMLPEVVWKIPSLGTFNLHGSLLPQYRGAAPIQWAVMNGDRQTGVTTFMIDDKIDTGGILLSATIPIGENSTGGEIHDELMKVGAELVVKTVDGLMNGSLSPIPQPDLSEIKSAPKLFKEHMKLDIDSDIAVIHNHVRGLYPYPCAFVEINMDNQIQNIKLSPGKFNEKQSDRPAMVVEQDTIYLRMKHGEYYPDQIQWPGKRMMTIKEVLNGLRFRGEIELV